MKIYQNSYTDGDFTHAGYEWFTSKAEANRVWVARHRAGHVIDGDHSIRAATVTIGPKKAGIIHLLNQNASYPADQHYPEAFEPGGEI
jgi:hypothetical protein